MGEMINVTPAPQGETTVKTTPVESTGTETVASEGSQEQDSAGLSQENAEGGSVDTQASRTRTRSKLDTIVELRQKLRERDQRYGSEIETLRSEINELKNLSRPSDAEKKPRKTFWEAPEEVLEERFSNYSKSLKEEIVQELRQVREQDQQTSEWKQETSEAAKFIKSQNGLTDDDIEDIKELIRESPAMKAMRPMERAEYAMYLFGKQRGITDKSAIKAKAATVTGSVGTQNGLKTWTQAEITSEIDRMGDPKNWSKEQTEKFASFEREIRKAQSEGRVK